MKEPTSNSYEAGINTGLTGIGLKGSGGVAPDYAVDLNTSIISDDSKTGMALYGFTRERKMFDSNNDGYSEISPMNNQTIGTRFFHRFGFRSKISIDFFNIKEERNGGNRQEYPLHERDVAEDGAVVKGINMELKVKPFRNFSLTSGFTIQSSMYDVPQQFDKKEFFRTPSDYGYFNIDWDFVKNAGLSATGTYTGRMLVPYFGPLTDPDIGELRKSDHFFDLGSKIHYNKKLNGASLQLFTGIKNIFNSFQSDFDSGIDRDPAYIYGPVSPRTVYFGIKIGNELSRLNQSGNQQKPKANRVRERWRGNKTLVKLLDVLFHHHDHFICTATHERHFHEHHHKCPIPGFELSFYSINKIIDKTGKTFYCDRIFINYIHLMIRKRTDTRL